MWTFLHHFLHIVSRVEFHSQIRSCERWKAWLHFLLGHKSSISRFVVQNLSPVLSDLFIQRTTPREMTPGGSSDEQPHMAPSSTVQAHTHLHNKYCHCLEDAERKSMSHCDLTTHTCPTCFRERLSCILCVHKCVYATVWGGEQKRVRARHRNTGVFWFRRQISTIIRWIVSHAQHLSRTHTHCLFQTHKHSHYMVITVRLMLCSPLYYALSLLSPSFCPRLSFFILLHSSLRSLCIHPSRRCRSWSSDWRWRRTSSKSVWRIRWRSAYMSREERRPEDGDRSRQQQTHIHVQRCAVTCWAALRWTGGF